MSLTMSIRPKSTAIKLIMKGTTLFNQANKRNITTLVTPDIKHSEVLWYTEIGNCMSNNRFSRPPEVLTHGAL